MMRSEGAGQPFLQHCHLGAVTGRWRVDSAASGVTSGLSALAGRYRPNGSRRQRPLRHAPIMALIDAARRASHSSSHIRPGAARSRSVGTTSAHPSAVSAVAASPQQRPQGVTPRAISGLRLSGLSRHACALERPGASRQSWPCRTRRRLRVPVELDGGPS